jgi:hypothetical protein
MDPLDQSSGELLPNVKTGDVLPWASSPPSKKTRKVYQVSAQVLVF